MAKGGYWIPAAIEDKEFTYSHEAHGPIKLKGTPWLYCRFCGLMYLNNAITKWCIRMGCNHVYHRDFKRMLYQMTTRRKKPWGSKT